MRKARKFSKFSRKLAQAIGIFPAIPLGLPKAALAPLLKIPFLGHSPIDSRGR